MLVRLLVLHRKESYPGEYAPEVMAAVDEGTLVDDPAWWEGAVAEQKAACEGETGLHWAEVDLDVPTEAVMEALYPTPTTIAVSPKPVVR